MIDLWAERTAALGGRPDVAYVLVFENHGAEVGATIAHPHGQIFAFPEVPPVPAHELARLAAGHPLLEDDPPGERIVVERDGWRAWVPRASIYPYGLRVAPLDQRPDLPVARRRRARRAGLGAGRRAGPARPPVRPAAAVHVLVPPAADRRRRLAAGLAAPRDRRAVAGPGVMRFVAGGELGSGVFVNPVAPEARRAEPAANVVGRAAG